MDDLIVSFIAVFIVYSFLESYFGDGILFFGKKKLDNLKNKLSENCEIGNIEEIEESKIDTLIDYNSTSNKKIQEWSLLLSSQLILHQVKKNSDNLQYWTILVTKKDKKTAENIIITVEKKNENTKFKKRLNSAHKNEFDYFFKVKSLYITLVPLLLFIFHLIVYNSNGFIGWVNSGNASADNILEGEWYRAITALTLHADFGHLLSNMSIGFVAAFLVALQVGTGFGWFIILISGFLGNIINALAYGTNHYSIGASTAVFGAIGIICGLQVHREYRRKKWIPVVVGLMFFGLMGTAGENTDIGAHLFGLLSGLIIGFLVPLLIARFSVNKAEYQLYWGFIAEIIIIVSWVVALGIV